MGHGKLFEKIKPGIQLFKVFNTHNDKVSLAVGGQVIGAVCSNLNNLHLGVWDYCAGLVFHQACDCAAVNLPPCRRGEENLCVKPQSIGVYAQPGVTQVKGSGEGSA